MKSILLGFVGALCFQILFYTIIVVAQTPDLPGSWTCVLGPSGLSCPQHFSIGGELVLKEPSSQGSSTFSVKVPDSGLTATNQVILNADGTLPAGAFTNTGSSDSCTAGYKYACVPN